MSSCQAGEHITIESIFLQPIPRDARCLRRCTSIPTLQNEELSVSVKNFGRSIKCNICSLRGGGFVTLGTAYLSKVWTVWSWRAVWACSSGCSKNSFWTRVQCMVGVSIFVYYSSKFARGLRLFSVLAVKVHRPMFHIPSSLRTMHYLEVSNDRNLLKSSYELCVPANSVFSNFIGVVLEGDREGKIILRDAKTMFVVDVIIFCWCALFMLSRLYYLRPSIRFCFDNLCSFHNLG